MNDTPFNEIAPIVVVFSAVAFSAASVALLTLGLGVAQWARPSPHRIGGRFGVEKVEVIDWDGESGHVLAGGELWRANGPGGLSRGDRVTVKKTEGLTLFVRRG